MNYRKIICDNYNIHIINNKNFHTIDFRIHFTQNANIYNVTYNNALLETLLFACKKYDTKRKLIKKFQQLFSLAPQSTIVRFGNTLCTKIGVSMVSSQYIDNSKIIDNILLIREIILNPLVENNQFNEKYLNIVKEELKKETERVNEEPRLYANMKLLEKLGNNEVYTLTGFSDLNILKEVTTNSLYEYYIDLIKHSKIDIFIAGNLKNEEEIIKTIKNNFIFNTHCNLLKPEIIHKLKKNKPDFYTEKRKLQQSKISIGIKFYHLTDFETRYVAHIFNSMLGGSASSFLMREIREEKGLCYYIDSYISKLDNILIINSGIRKSDYHSFLESVNKSLEKIREGKFKKSDLDTSIIENVSNVLNIKDSNDSLIEYYFGREVFHSDELNMKVKKIKSITKEDIIKIANKVKIDAIYFLEGEL